MISFCFHLKWCEDLKVYPVLHYALPKYLQLEKVQRRALLCIFPKISHANALQLARIDNPQDHLKNWLCHSFSQQLTTRLSKIHYLIPPSNKSPYNLRKKQEYQQPSTETKRVADSFIYKCIIKQFNEFLYFFIPGIN